MAGAVNHVVLLVLLGAVVSRGETEDCEALTRRQPTAQLDKVFGDWVSVWGSADHPEGVTVLDSVKTLHVQWRLLPDNRTVQFNERNLFKYDESLCITVVINNTVESEAESLTLQSISTAMDINGIPRPYNESYRIDFYEACNDCLLFVYNTLEHGRFLMNYRREGLHQNVTELNEAEERMQKQAKCLDFPTDKPYVYDRVSGFCHHKSAPVETNES